MAAPPPPPGWELLESRSKPGRFFYHHKVTGETRWSLPACKMSTTISSASSNSKRKRKGPAAAATVLDGAQKNSPHMRGHTGERPFQSSHRGCGKAFTEKGNLTRHFRDPDRRLQKQQSECEARRLQRQQQAAFAALQQPPTAAPAPARAKIVPFWTAQVAKEVFGHQPPQFSTSGHGHFLFKDNQNNYFYF